jgi:hypothetical protein
MLSARAKACQSFTSYLAGCPRTGLGVASSGEDSDDDEDLLSKFGATTRKIARNRSRGSSPGGLTAVDGLRVRGDLARSEPLRGEPIVPLPLAPPAAGYHPQVLEYLRALPANAQVPDLGSALFFQPTLSNPIQGQITIPDGDTSSSGTQLAFVGDTMLGHPPTAHYNGGYRAPSGVLATQTANALSTSYTMPTDVPTLASTWNAPTTSPNYVPFASDPTTERSWASGAANYLDAYSAFGQGDSVGVPVLPAAAFGSSTGTAPHMHIHGQPPGAPDWALLLSQILDTQE